MTDDDILAAAEVIKKRRLNEARLASFELKEDVMIRWDNIGARSIESYTSITIPALLVAGIVRGHYNSIIATENNGERK